MHMPQVHVDSAGHAAASFAEQQLTGYAAVQSSGCCSGSVQLPHSGEQPAALDIAQQQQTLQQQQQQQTPVLIICQGQQRLATARASMHISSS
jgi:GMP synthase-like glutamine amidotransferase